MVFVTDPKAEKIFVAELQDELLFTPIASTLRPRGITYDPLSKKIYWTEGQVRRIVRADINGSNIEIVTKFSPGQYRLGLDDIVVAVKSRTLYVACRRVNRISSVLIAEGGPLPWNQTNFLTEGIVWPRALAVDEEQGYLYWSMENTIARTFLNGSGQVEVIYMNNELQNFTGLTIDLRRQVRRIFFYDSTKKRIWYKDAIRSTTSNDLSSASEYLSDENRMIVKRVRHISFFNNVLFWLHGDESTGIGLMTEYDQDNQSYIRQDIDIFENPYRMHIAYTGD
ncbi:low-density lipoprotein receptor-related protein 6-like [Lytechinus variegatus]|uniref:low-density lipoprotein receptor-related protein 6-like n=1 Tax=Lytechinus variegatus TaxID=7654 RepID=UPI001BB0D7EA|nr:low-density lipoprotein receptor-related protein 6-like [Lytechinus variegatus]